jgi:hypothetical protein
MPSIEQPDVAALSEGFCFVGEAPRGDHKPTRRTTRGHHAIQLAHHRHTHLQGLPLLALNKEGFAILSQHQIDAAIRSATARLLHRIAALSKALAHEHFELAP